MLREKLNLDWNQQSSFVCTVTFIVFMTTLRKFRFEAEDNLKWNHFTHIY